MDQTNISYIIYALYGTYNKSAEIVYSKPSCSPDKNWVQSDTHFHQAKILLHYYSSIHSGEWMTENRSFGEGEYQSSIILP